MTTADFPGSSGTTYSGGTDQGGAQEKAQQVAGTAAEEGRHVAATARDEAQNVAAEARAQARNLMSEATSQLDEQSRAQKNRLVETARTFGDDLEEMAADRGGLASDVARQIADRARTMSSHLEGREPGELLDEVRDFARRRPGTFLLGALAAGVVAGRLTRAAKASQDDHGSGVTPTAGVESRGGLPATAFPPVPASPAEPIGSGVAAPASDHGLAGIDEPGTASGDPLAGTRVQDNPPTYPVATPEAEAAPWSDPGSRP